MDLPFTTRLNYVKVSSAPPSSSLTMPKALTRKEKAAAKVHAVTTLEGIEELPSIAQPKDFKPSDPFNFAKDAPYNAQVRAKFLITL